MGYSSEWQNKSCKKNVIEFSRFKKKMFLKQNQEADLLFFHNCFGTIIKNIYNP